MPTRRPAHPSHLRILHRAILASTRAFCDPTACRDHASGQFRRGGGTMATVMTVRGPVPAEQLGLTLMHEHLLLDLTRDTWTNNNFLSDPDLTLLELQRFKDAGGKTLVDQTTRGLGQDPRAVREMAERS